MAPVLGHGMSQELEHVPPIGNPHGFSIEWLRIEAGERVGAYKLAEKQVLLVFTGAIAVTLDDDAPVRAETQEVFSVPADCWRTIASVGEATAEIAVVTAGDHKKHPVWHRDIVNAARSAGFALDHSGYVAPLALLPYDVPTRAA